jgi:hypothetical protein
MALAANSACRIQLFESGSARIPLRVLQSSERSLFKHLPWADILREAH